MKKLIFKAKLRNGPIQIVGSYELSDEEWEEEMSYGTSEEDWLNNTGSDWAYEAVHSDCLEYWAEFDED